MRTFLGVAALAALLAGGSIATAQAEGMTAGGRIQLAQLDDPGDGLDGRTAVRQGNARPYREGMHGRRMRHHRMRRHRRHR